MNNIINILMMIVVITFISFIYYFYSSNKNINTKKFNRSNIEKILKEKTSNLLILTSDTHNIIEFNESSKNDFDNNKQRSFWELLQKK